MVSSKSSKKSIKKIAVLFTDIIGSTLFFQIHGDLAGRKMLRQHEEIVSKATGDFGGKVVKNIGDSILAFFTNPQEATKVAIRIQKELNRFNSQKDPEHEIHVRIGIHFGDGIIEDNDIFGDVVNTASKLTDIAGGDQIFISQDVFALVNTLSSLEFESVEIPYEKDAPAKPEIYQVLWDKSVDFDPAIVSVTYMRPIQKLGARDFNNIWNDLIRSKALFWNNKIDDETIIEDQTVILLAKSPSVLMDVANDVLKFLIENLNLDKKAGILPVQIIIDAGPNLEIDNLVEEKFKAKWDELPPGTIHVSHFAWELIKKEQNSIAASVKRSGRNQAQPFYEITPDDYKQKDNTLIFLYQNALCKGQNLPCFYCGSKEHAATGCLSKYIVETTNVLNKLGYLSFDKINDIFLGYLMSSDEEKLSALESLKKSSEHKPLACLGFYELKQFFQLRYFKSIWDDQSSGLLKNKSAKDGSADKGGSIWLAQDCIRVSNLNKAESLLKTCLGKYPEDYRVYCSLGFLEIEKGILLNSENYFNKALYYAKTNPQKIFILLLLFRLYDLTDDPDNALKKIREIFAIDPFYTEAVYQEIIFKFKQKKQEEALGQLIELIPMNREYFVKALIDPDLKDFSRIIHPELKNLFREARQKAQKIAYNAEREFSKLERFLKQGDEEIEKASKVLLKIRNIVGTNSYFGYLDMTHLGNSMIRAIREIIKDQKKELMNAVKETYKFAEKIFSHTRNYHSALKSDPAYKQLMVVQSELKQIGKRTELNDFGRFHEMTVQCGKISEELKKIEPELRKLKTISDVKRFLIIFLKNSALILSFILIAGIIIYPVTIYYFNAFFPGFGLSASGNTGLYHKYFIIFGVLGGLSFSFFKSFKTFLKQDTEEVDKN